MPDEAERIHQDQRQLDLAAIQNSQEALSRIKSHERHSGQLHTIYMNEFRSLNKSSEERSDLLHKRISNVGDQVGKDTRKILFWLLGAASSIITLIPALIYFLYGGIS